MTSIRKFLSRAALGTFVASLFFASTSHAQVRQTSLYIDDGSGHFNILQADPTPKLGGTYLFPSTGGTNMIITTANLSDITGGTSFTPGGVFYGITASTMGTTVAGTSGNVLVSGGAGAPTWAAQTGIVNTLSGDVTGASNNNTINTASAPTGNNIVTAIGQGTGVIGVANGGTGAATVGTGNEVFASPNGTSGAPGFRPLVDADLPSDLGTEYIQNQNAGPQTTSNFNISGTGTAATGFVAPLFHGADAADSIVTTVRGNNNSVAAGSGGSLTIIGGQPGTGGKGGQVNIVGGPGILTDTGNVNIYGGGINFYPSTAAGQPNDNVNVQQGNLSVQKGNIGVAAGNITVGGGNASMANSGLITGKNVTISTFTTAGVVLNSSSGVLSSTAGPLPLANGGTAANNTSIPNHEVFIGPISSGPGNAGFRPLDATDIPDLSGNYIDNQSSPAQTANFNISGNGTISGILDATGSIQNTTSNPLLISTVNGELTTIGNPTGTTTMPGTVNATGSIQNTTSNPLLISTVNGELTTIGNPTGTTTMPGTVNATGSIQNTTSNPLLISTVNGELTTIGNPTGTTTMPGTVNATGSIQNTTSNPLLISTVNGETTTIGNPTGTTTMPGIVNATGSIENTTSNPLLISTANGETTKIGNPTGTTTMPGIVNATGSIENTTVAGTLDISTASGEATTIGNLTGTTTIQGPGVDLPGLATAAPLNGILGLNGSNQVVISNAAIVEGSGTQNTLPKWNNPGGTTLGDSKLTDDGTDLVYNSTFDVSSTGAVSGVTTLTSSGNTTVGTGASTANTFGSGGATSNTFGNDATTNNFAQEAIAGETLANNFGGATTATGTVTNKIGFAPFGATVSTQIGGGTSASTVNISTSDWSITALGAGTLASLSLSTTPLAVGSGGTGLSTLTNNAVLYGTGTGVGLTNAANADGQLLIGASGGAPAFATVGTGTGISLTTGTNSLTINNTGTLSVSGTTNEIDVTAGQNPVVSIDAGYVGQGSITTLGTIGTGTWQGTAVALGFGGTGVDGTSLTQNEVFASPDGTTGPAGFRTLTNNDLPSGGSITINTGTGLSGGGPVAPGGTLTLANTGVTSNIAGAGISVSGATGDVTIGNTGTLSVSGTTNEIDVTAGQNPVVSIDAGYVGQGSITTLGTIGTGTWQGTAVALGFGGTGVDGTSLTQNEVFASPDGTTGPAGFRTLTNNDLPSGGSITINTGTGLSGGGPVAPGGTLTLANTGVTSNIAGAGISVSGATGDVTIGNTGTLSVSGTTNEIDVTAGQNPVVSIDAGYVGQGSITTLGTIGTGTWQGTAVALGFGGTGVDGTSLTQNEVFASPDGTTGPAGFRTLTNNDLPSGGSITINTGTGLSGGGPVAPGGTLTLANTGVTSNIAGAGISVSGATGDVTIGNTGTLSVSGTTNEIDVTAGQNPVVSIDAGYVGQGSITTLGTIGTGTWQGTAVGLQYGGTGQDNTAIASNHLVFAGPVSSAPGTASFRLLDATDIPDLSGNYIDNQSSPAQTANFNISGSGTIGGTLNVNDIEDGVSLTINTGAGKNTTIGNSTGSTVIATNTWGVDVTGNGTFAGLASTGNSTIATNGSTTNTFGNGGNANNSIGDGGSAKNSFGSVGGSITNSFGDGASAINTFGTGASATNTIGSTVTSSTTILGGTTVGINNSGHGPTSIGNASGGVTIQGTNWGVNDATGTATLGSSLQAGSLVITDGAGNTYALQAATGGSFSPTFLLPTETGPGPYTLATADQIPNGTNYIENQTHGGQTGNFWITGNGTIQGTLDVNDIEEYSSGPMTIQNDGGDLTVGSAAFGIDGAVTFANTTGNNDITGTAGWNVDKAGNANFVSIGTGTAGTGAFSTLAVGSTGQLTVDGSGDLSTSGTIATTGASGITSAGPLKASGTLVYSTEGDATDGVSAVTVTGSAVFAAVTGTGSGNITVSVTAVPVTGQVLLIYNNTSPSQPLVLNGQYVFPSYTGKFIYYGSQWILMQN